MRTPICRSLALAFLAAVAGCDDDGSLGPDSIPRLTGQWVYTAPALEGVAVTCSTTPTRMNLVQTGALEVDARFTGDILNFEIECRREGRSTALFFPEGSDVLNGELEDDRVAFDFEDPDFLHTGTIEGDRMSGTVATRLDLSGTILGDLGTVDLVGNWEAVRQ